MFLTQDELTELTGYKQAAKQIAMLRARFEKARTDAGLTGEQFQFRDLRRKSGSDLRDQAGLDAAQDLLGHKSQSMTEHYTAARGKKVTAIPKRRAK